MKLEYRHTYDSPRETVWAMLQDDSVLLRTLPGCKRLQPVGDGVYDTELGLDVGPIKGLFQGQVQISDVQPPSHYRLQLQGRGKPGELTADSHISLTEENGVTQVVCEAEAQATGLLASVGQRVMGSIARLLLGRFFKNVESELKKAAI
ncbi:carbon monoxide dehydrogenase subunit G [Alicyclobacillus tolerans]|uniref:CoxG family protein n=1 Tax=Alicyclobacillus tolerans TaxID=90970 RepID=UPI001F2D2058|nr:carbon monoxide dehydrogenase subunit G [Alicyclobacillus tolerans]MCF8565314.1 carbon monoxide dehydrogenase subunit G [Alicyclobacillus tolerans]